MEPARSAPDPASADLAEAPDAAQAAGPGPWRCAADPSVETYLRCGRCDTPICPRCLIQTPVGSRCRSCAQIRRLPMFVLRPVDYLKAIGAGLGSAIVAGAALALILNLVPFLGILRILLMVGFGYVVGEAVNRFTGNKQGNVLGIIAAASIPIGMILAQASFFLVNGAPPELALIASGALFIRQISSLRELWTLLGIVLAAAVAYSRAR
jgi:hypothetical protein